MPELNPYTPPVDANDPPARSTTGKKSRSRHYYREGNLVVVEKLEARLPKRCVVCNERSAGDRLRKQFSWHPQWVFATIFIGFLIYIIAAAVTRKHAIVEFGLCQKHKERRDRGMLVSWIGAAVTVVCFLMGIVSETPLLILVGVLGAVGTVIANVTMARTAYPTKIDDTHVWLKVGEPFLASIAERDD
jgi:hypothetical protein